LLFAYTTERTPLAPTITAAKCAARPSRWPTHLTQVCKCLLSHLGDGGSCALFFPTGSRLSVLWSGLVRSLVSAEGPIMVTFVPAVVRNGISESAPAVLYQAFEEPTHSRLSPDRACLRPVLLTAACDASKSVNSYGIRISPAAAARTAWK
jgi:hypothetical protein